MVTAVVGFKAFLVIGGFCHAYYVMGNLSLDSLNLTLLTPESLSESLWTFTSFVWRSITCNDKPWSHVLVSYPVQPDWLPKIAQD